MLCFEFNLSKIVEQFKLQLKRYSWKSANSKTSKPFWIQLLDCSHALWALKLLSKHCLVHWKQPNKSTRFVLFYYSVPSLRSMLLKFNSRSNLKLEWTNTFQDEMRGCHLPADEWIWDWHHIRCNWNSIQHIPPF